MPSEESFERIRKAVEARDRFLREHPELQPFQDEITELMQKLGSHENRMAVLDTMMRERLMELHRRLAELREAFLRILPEDFDLDAALEALADKTAEASRGGSATGAEDREKPVSGERDPSRPKPPARQSDDHGGKRSPGGARILGPADGWPVPDGITGRDRSSHAHPPARPARRRTPTSPASEADEDRSSRRGDRRDRSDEEGSEAEEGRDD